MGVPNGPMSTPNGLRGRPMGPQVIPWGPMGRPLRPFGVLMQHLGPPWDILKIVHFLSISLFRKFKEILRKY